MPELVFKKLVQVAFFGLFRIINVHHHNSLRNGTRRICLEFEADLALPFPVASFDAFDLDAFLLIAFQNDGARRVRQVLLQFLV